MENEIYDNNKIYSLAHTTNCHEIETTDNNKVTCAETANKIEYNSSIHSLNQNNTKNKHLHVT